jgi:hypothetical protein
VDGLYRLGGSGHEDWLVRAMGWGGEVNETLLYNQKGTWCNNLENHCLYSHCCENLNSYKHR